MDNVGQEWRMVDQLFFNVSWFLGCILDCLQSTKQKGGILKAISKNLHQEGGFQYMEWIRICLQLKSVIYIYSRLGLAVANNF